MAQYEYKDFTKEWKYGSFWYRPGSRESEIHAREWFWNEEQREILKELSQWEDEGWERVSVVGPAAFILKEAVKEENNIDYIDVVFWILTFGLFFLFQLVTGQFTRKVLYYYAVEFRVSMRRPVIVPVNNMG